MQIHNIAADDEALDLIHARGQLSDQLQLVKIHHWRGDELHPAGFRQAAFIFPTVGLVFFRLQTDDSSYFRPLQLPEIIFIERSGA